MTIDYTGEENGNEPLIRPLKFQKVLEVQGYILLKIKG
tara:strand:+ start:374 stop:487 length:114 start_codon:yes stop_codon:yes gene_type:complete